MGTQMDLSKIENQQELIKAKYALNLAIDLALERGETNLGFVNLVLDSLEIRNKLEALPEPELKKLLTNANSLTE